MTGGRNSPRRARFGPNRDILVYPDAESLSRAAAFQVAHYLGVRLQDLGDGAVPGAASVSLVLSGGSTPIRIYEILAAGARGSASGPPAGAEGSASGASAREHGSAPGAAVRARGSASGASAGTQGSGSTLAAARSPLDDPSLPWSRIHVFWGDERCVPSDDPASNYGNARRALLDPAGVPEENIHRFTAAGTPAEAASAGERMLRAFFGIMEGRGGEEDAAAFDLVLLGLGRDGHTASLFPDDPVLNDHEHWVRAVRAPEGMEAPDRITMTPPRLCRARAVLFFVSGSEKEAIVARVLGGAKEPGEAMLPAERITPEGGVARWLLDEEAARGLPPSVPVRRVQAGAV